MPGTAQAAWADRPWGERPGDATRRCGGARLGVRTVVECTAVRLALFGVSCERTCDPRVPTALMSMACANDDHAQLWSGPRTLPKRTAGGPKRMLEAAGTTPAPSRCRLDACLWASHCSSGGRAQRLTAGMVARYGTDTMG